MHPFNKMKKVGLVLPQAIKDNLAFVGSNSSTPATVDSIGYDSIYFDITLGATDIVMTTLQLLHSDDNSTYVASTPHTFGGTGLPALPSATDDDKSFGVEVDLRAFPYRYWRIEAFAGNGATGTFLTANAFLARADEAPTTDAERGYAAIIKPA